MSTLVHRLDTLLTTDVSGDDGMTNANDDDVKRRDMQADRIAAFMVVLLLWWSGGERRR